MKKKTDSKMSKEWFANELKKASKIKARNKRLMRSNIKNCKRWTSTENNIFYLVEEYNKKNKCQFSKKDRKEIVNLLKNNIVLRLFENKQCKDFELKINY